MIDTPNPPDSLVYSGHGERFHVVASVLRVFSRLTDNRIIESRELHVSTVPESKEVKRAFESMPFRLVENTNENRTDRHGNPIVGGINKFPSIHAALFISPEAIAMLSQRAMVDSKDSKFTIFICPAISILEWDQSDAIPIYESTIQCGSVSIR